MGISYLGLFEEELPFLRFQIGDRGERSVANEVVPMPDGTSIRIKNVSRGAYWRRNGEASDFILAEDDLTTPGPDSLFQPIKVDGQTIVLRNLGNNMFASRAGYYLQANEPEIEEFFSELTLYELVSSKRIKDIKFLLEYGWVYDETLVVVNPGEAVTNESGVARTLSVEIRYKDVRSCTLKANGPTMRLGPVVRIQPDEIGSISDSSAIELIAPFELSYLWGPYTTQVGDPDQIKVHEVTVPPWSTVTVKLTASLATYEKLIK
ncbi:unnamed protein product [Linum tenue]|uniref:Minor tail protein n=1 Tax=Linum tenue TaxID=586396 RepID=A0AAV0II33_9ROSI|nr:unnamed protein product [Linum tenue]